YEKLLGSKKQEYIHLAASLDALSPLKVLDRGYSMVSDKSGNLLSSADKASVGDSVKISFSRSSLLCTVDEKIID
ncbi:MAG: exodeoxyribonuclease VII large subunit, partial [Oscillospiraceae bacterium]